MVKRFIGVDAGQVLMIPLVPLQPVDTDLPFTLKILQCLDKCGMYIVLTMNLDYREDILLLGPKHCSCSFLI